MLPPIKRATLTADTLFKERGTAISIPLWKNAKGTRKTEYKIDSRLLFSARSEFELLELLEQFPGESAYFYARRLKGRNRQWVRTTLQQYAGDGLVLQSLPPGKLRPYLWTLT